MLMRKFIFITGGVCSSLGKGIASSVIASLLECRGYRIVLQKIDPYLNVDAGTMSPFQHGEVYVTDDGAETDLDLGNYSRFTNMVLSSLNSITAGKVYKSVIEKERKGEYLGKTVQVIPHVTDEIQLMIEELNEKEKPDFHIVEIGGTVGDIESVPFLEAAREFFLSRKKDVLFIHLTLIPKIEVAGEYKTKPTQHSVGILRQIGIVPDIILTRISGKLTKEMKKKISLFCSVDFNDVFEAPDVDNIYELPLIYYNQGIDVKILEKFNIEPKSINLSKWEEISKSIKDSKESINLFLCGKYVNLNDAYKSIYEAIKHAGLKNKTKIKIHKIDTEDVETNIEILDHIKREADAIIVPGGFGSRGIEGKIKIIKLARENRIPFLGICLGMQCMTIEYSRNVANIKDANSEEFETNGKNKVICLMEEQKNVKNLGGTMRLGAYSCRLAKNSKVYEVYNSEIIYERHRHRYEFNNEYRKLLQENGLIISGVNEELDLVEVVEWPDHPFGIGVQFHPEFKSKPFDPHPLFKNLIEEGLKYKKNKYNN
ncbi:MAG: CTP synthase [Spirochaetes bacterium]|nr:CTP synthase [Spirochaetota bacterium]